MNDTPNPSPHRAPVSPDSSGPVRPLRDSWHLLRDWWQHVTADIDHLAVIEKVHGESEFTPRYTFMICMSAGIAILGLLLSSPAVVIGAMLLSPLMGPIMGLGFALAIGDVQWMKSSGKAVAAGSIFAILFCALIVTVSPLNTVTSEIAARTRPNLFDLAVALFSALAGSYAMIRGREGTIVGVAIATALMPPLAVVGFGLATFNWTVFGGSLLLFFTNLMTIALTATIMARLNGFRTTLSPKQTMIQSVAVVGIFLVLAIPLGLTLQQIAWETNASRQGNAAVSDEFDPRARISQIEFEFDAEPIKLNASVLTPNLVSGAEERVRRELQRALGRAVEVTINQYKVGTDAADAEAAQLAAARAQAQQQATEREIADLTDRMALIAGVEPSNVTVDRTARRAMVKAARLPGATLATYQALEQRLTRLKPDWSLEVRPPALALPDIELLDGQTGDISAGALDLASWASKRLDSPIGVGGDAERAQLVLDALKQRGAAASANDAAGAGSANRVPLIWLAPDQVVDE